MIKTPFQGFVVMLPAVCCLFCLTDPASAGGPDSGEDPWFRAHVFTGSGGCLAVQDGQSLEQGDTIQVFEKGKPVSTRRVAYLISSERAEQVYKEWRFDGVYKNSALRDSFGCYWGMRSDPPRWIARCEDAQDQGLGLPVAIRDLPAGSLMIGGDGKVLSPQEVLQESHQLTASTPKEFQESRILRAGRRYTSRPGNGITEILLGRPFGAAAPFDSIQILTLFVHNKRVLAAKRFSRVTGVEERVDSEAPALDEKNWFELQEETMGFFSVDTGSTWNRVSVDIGFEGIVWSIRALSDGSPELWGRDLYTAH